jgi:acetylornithine deacetylase/succinyl-diaminopimelate desuccinylase-like protein
MTRENAISHAEKMFDDGSFFNLLNRRVAHTTESQNEERTDELRDYLTGEMGPYLEGMGFTYEVLENPVVSRLPFLVGQRIEADDAPTLLTYGHGDTVLAMTEQWQDGLNPWRLTMKGERWYGRGAADNKGQHSINLAALDCVLHERGRLGFNAKVLIEMGEEMGSPGLREICNREKKMLSADVLIASDGPRIDPQKPTIFGGSRGVFNFDLSLTLREGGHHSGNWGGLLANPGVILAHAIASMIDTHGRVLVDGLTPEKIPDSVRKALAELEVTGRKGPEIDPEWGEPGLSPAEKVYGWNTLEVLAFECGNPAAPAHAIPAGAWARCHIRYVADTDPEKFHAAVQKHLAAHGFDRVKVTPVKRSLFKATRMDPEDPWVKWVVSSVECSTNQRPAFLPNIGGSLPNDIFQTVLGLPTIWIPHSYGGCSQHAPNEHLLSPLAKDGLRMMAGIFWDLAENSPAGTVDE